MIDLTLHRCDMLLEFPDADSVPFVLFPEFGMAGSGSGRCCNVLRTCMCHVGRLLRLREKLVLIRLERVAWKTSSTRDINCMSFVQHFHPKPATEYDPHLFCWIRIPHLLLRSTPCQPRTLKAGHPLVPVPARPNPQRGA